MNLDEIRRKLDELDKELVLTLVKRLKLIPEVAKYKKENNIKRYQPEREKQIIEEKRKLAEEYKINPDLIEDLFKRIIQEAHKIEKEIMGE